MSIKKINEFPVASGVNLTPDDIFLMMDDPSGVAATKKVSLSTLSNFLGGGGGNANTGDIVFNNSTISTSDENADISITCGENTWSLNKDGTVSLPNQVLDGGSNSVEIKSSAWAGLWYSSGPSGTNNSWIDNPNLNTSAFVWVDEYGIFLQNHRQDDGLNPSWNHVWSFKKDGNSQFPGNLELPNGTSVATGTFDNGTGGQNGISLNCAVGYELNWQAGHLRNIITGDGSGIPQTIYIDSPIQFPGSGLNYMAVDSSGITFPDGTIQTSAATGGGGLSDSNTYIICKTGDDIAAKYAAAKALTPGGSALSATNRAYLVVMPGVYPLTAQWEIDAEFVDIIGLGSTPLDRGCNVSVTVTDFDINVSANDVRIKGIGTPSDRAFKIDGDKPLQVFEECVGGNYSFGGDSFFFDGITSGTFTNCSGGDGSFGGSGGTASGTFTNCSSGETSFGGYGGTASGTFINCSGGVISFGGFLGGTASGTFINCSGVGGSFGGSGGTASGTFKDCSGGEYSFGSTASGTFKDCSGGEYSFGSTASGTFLRCTLTSGTFQTLSETGKYRLCIDGNYDVINADAPTTP